MPIKIRVGVQTQVSVQLLMYVCVYAILHVCMHMACVQSEAKETKKWPQETNKGQKKPHLSPEAWALASQFYKLWQSITVPMLRTHKIRWALIFPLKAAAHGQHRETSSRNSERQVKANLNTRMNLRLGNRLRF